MPARAFCTPLHKKRIVRKYAANTQPGFSGDVPKGSIAHKKNSQKKTANTQPGFSGVVPKGSICTAEK